MRSVLLDLWLQWRAHRHNVKHGREFLRQPHDKYDPECVLFDDHRHLVLGDWNARCPSCNPRTVHFVLVGGGAVHAFVLGAPAGDFFTGDRDKVTCPICLGVLAQMEAV